MRKWRRFGYLVERFRTSIALKDMSETADFY